MLRVGLGQAEGFDTRSIVARAIGTDGSRETSNSKGEMFGRERFKTLLRDNHHLSATGILNLVFEELEAFRAGQKAEDDITLVIFKVKNK